MMPTRISKKFDVLKRQKRKALIPFFMPGAQGKQSIEKTIVSLEKAGADLIELGIPFSDPVADGPVIQKSAQVALDRGVHTDDVFDAVEKAREITDVPLLFLVYFNSIFKYGQQAFIDRCVAVGIDGLIIPDLPFEEQDELKVTIGEKPIDIITLAAKTSHDRLKKILPRATGFVYCISSTGVTGERSQLMEGLSDFLEKIKEQTKTPRSVGFGVSTPEQAAQISQLAEGVIIGSALVRRFLEQGTNAGIRFIHEVRKAMDEQ